MWKLAAIFLVVAIVSQDVMGQCKPGDNCKAPDCRCWDDPNIPGNFSNRDVPQMVIISFEYGVNTGNVDTYREVFDGLSNPNGCQPKGTFFVSEVNTDFDVVKSLYDEKHEIAMTTPSGNIPEDADQWKQAFADMKAKIAGAGIPVESVKGTRGASLYCGGNEQFDSITENKLVYDSTCASIEYIDKSNLIWPYTYDFVETTPSCTIGTSPSKPYPGKWQFLVADMVFGETKCAVPSSCAPFITDSQGAFDLFYDSFAKHYDGPTRAPFIMFIDPMFLSVEYQKQGARQFLEFIRAAYDDVWIVTNEQALAWIQDPVNSDDSKDFKPWACT